MPDSHQKLIRGSIAGDRTAQAELYRLYASKMMGVCLWYCRSREEAEEVLQDGFIRVFKYLTTYHGKGSFEGWVRKIMVNAALLKYRNRSMNLWAITEFDGAKHDISEEASFISHFSEKELIKIVQRLPPAYRMVFNLHVLEGLKHREIAALLNISEGTSKSNLADARRLLRVVLKTPQHAASS